MGVSDDTCKCNSLLALNNPSVFPTSMASRMLCPSPGRFNRQKPSIGGLCFLCPCTGGGPCSTAKSGAACSLHFTSISRTSKHVNKRKHLSVLCILTISQISDPLSVV